MRERQRSTSRATVRASPGARSGRPCRSTNVQRAPKRRLGRVNVQSSGRRVEEQQERVVLDPLALRPRRGDPLAVEEQAEPRARPRRSSRAASCGARRGRNHHASGRPEPTVVLAREEVAPVEDRVRAAQRDQPLGELELAPRRARRAPSRTRRSRCPGTSRCCCRPACGRSRRRRAASACPGRGTAWPGSCAAGAPRRALTSGSSVSPSTPQFQERLSSVPSRLPSWLASLCLLVVGDEVVQREAVVRGDEVDRGERPAAVVLVEVARAGEPARELAAARPRRARSRASRRGRCRSTPTTGRGSCRPGSRPGRRPTARRSA